MSIRLACLTALVALTAALPAAASSAHCTPPTSASVVFSSLHESGIGCEAARTLALHYVRHNRLDHWSCSHTISGRTVRFACRKDADHQQTVAGSWRVH